jgi:DnaJ like chaperone protein
MSWLGKVVGGAFGFVMGGPLGAALGAALGHQFDQGGPEIRFETLGASPEETEVVRRAFFMGTFQVMGFVAKADGRVSESEIAVARHIMDRMQLTEDLKLLAMRLFNEGKDDRFGVASAIEEFRACCSLHAHLPRLFMALQVELALADGSVSRQEEATLLQICDQLGFSRYEYFGIKTRLEAERRFGGMGSQGNAHHQSGRFREEYRQRQQTHTESLGIRTELQEAYAILQLRATASEVEIKKAYRRLISRHHPDKLVGKGQGSESVQKATEMTQKIQKAYDLICKARGF